MINTAIVGLGWWGQTLVESVSGNSEKLRFISAVSRSASEAAKEFTQLHKMDLVQDFDTILADPKIDAVVLATPHSLHTEETIAAAEAGKHVFCEKPVGSSPYETLCATRVAEKNKIVTGVGYNYRWAPVVQFVRELINRGELGDITHYRGRFFVDYASNPDGVLSWRFDREKAGTGVLADVMSHVVDMAHMLVGPIREVVSSHKTWISDRPVATPGEGDHFSVQPEAPREPVTNEDDVSALVSFQCGAHGQLEVSRVAKGARCDMSFEIFAVSYTHLTLPTILLV